MTIRIATQPFPEYTRSMTDDQVLKFFRDYEALAGNEVGDDAIGPAMTSDADDPHEAELLAKIIANSKTLEGSISNRRGRWNPLAIHSRRRPHREIFGREHAAQPGHL